MVYFGFDPPHEDLGKFCPICGREHFNEGELCTRCKDRYTDDEEGE
jgi:hypothetical protein